ncbi:type II CAAX endopeptidase family protein [Candidatus Kapabacteria bacterium]|nr:type II CAAX endopeptidase family protein [Candidatus Kapabacteria bacterium]
MNHLERCFDNQNQWWKYLLVIIFGFLGGQLIGIIPSIVLVLSETGISGLDTNALTDLSSIGFSKNTNLVFLLLPFVFMLFISMGLVRYLHLRSFSNITNGTSKIRWNRIFYSSFLWLCILILSVGIDFISDPDNFTLNYNASEFWILCLISLLLIPLQTTSEEYFFRGYFYQVVGVISKNRLVAAIIPGIIFGLMHYANPEVEEHGMMLAMPHYILSGLVFGLITALDDGMELAIGAHAINNIFLSILITEKATVFQTDALFSVVESTIDWTSLIFMLFYNGIFIFFLHKKYKFNWSVLLKKVDNPNIDNTYSNSI